jgi:GTP-binding protein HflX
VLLVADGSGTEEQLMDQLTEVRAVLSDIGADDLPQIIVLNKIDRLDEVGRRRLANRLGDAVQVSAATGENLEELKARIAEFFANRFVDVRLLMPHENGSELSALYASGAPITEREDGEAGVLVSARLPRELLARYDTYRVDE